MEIPGVGPLLASAFLASVADPRMFKTGRDHAAWIGLVPQQNSSGGKERLGGISRAGNRYLRQMLVVGAMSSAMSNDMAPNGHGCCGFRHDARPRSLRSPSRTRPRVWSGR